MFAFVRLSLQLIVGAGSPFAVVSKGSRKIPSQDGGRHPEEASLQSNSSVSVVKVGAPLKLKRPFSPPKGEETRTLSFLGLSSYLNNIILFTS